MRSTIQLTLWLLGCAGTTDSGLDPTDPDTIDDVEPDPASPARRCDVTLSAPFPAGTDANVAGAFNGWNPQPMFDADGDGTFEASLGMLVARTYPYKFVFNGNWEDPPDDVYTAFDGGIENRALRVGDCRLPTLDAISGAASPDGTLEASFQFTRSADGDALAPSSLLVTVGGVEVVPDFDPATGVISVAVTGLSPGKHSVRVTARDTAGDGTEGGDAFLPLWVEDEPYSWEDGVLYYAFLDRFRDGGPSGEPALDGSTYGIGYLGGDLVGAKAAIDEGWFDDLGVTSIWLSPVNENPDGLFGGSFGYQYSGYHGYWPTRGRDVEDRLGTETVPPEQALHEFIDAAHAHGIRVLLDVVLNHVHEEHEYISAHPDWFGAPPCSCTSDSGPCNWDTNPLYCWFTDYLPDLDYKIAPVTDQMLADLEWWVETFDVDGFRVDAAKHMDHVIMRSSALMLRDKYEDAGGAPFYLVGETFTGAGGQGLIMQYVSEHELDGQFDFPLLYPIRNAIGQGQGFRGLSNEMKSSDAAYGPWVHGMSVFMGNHDVGRYPTDITGCAGYDPNRTVFGHCRDVLAEGGANPPTGEQWNLINRLSMSYAFVATQPGVPLLYYGDEVGLAGAGDPDNRRLMPWTRSNAQQTLVDRVMRLGQVRREHEALQEGGRRELWVDDQLFVYARNKGDDVAIVAMCLGQWGTGRTQSVPVPPFFQGLMSGGLSSTRGGLMQLPW